MYECQMKMIVPPGVGLLVAGLASGICFLIIGNLRKRRGEKNVDDSRCACCLKPFLVGRGVECSDCGARSCRKACCRWDSIDNSWYCLFCHHKRSYTRRKEKWFRNFGGLPVESEAWKNFSTAKSRIYDEGAENVAIHSELEVAAGGCKERNSMETVREFVEKMVEGLVGNVDDTPIDRLYDHSSYDRIFETYSVLLATALKRLAISLRPCADNKPATDTPTMAHTALRELVERAVDEARKLPSLGPTVSTELHDDSSLSDQNYEDLLATAILNKVIDKFQNERVDDNSNVVHQRPRSKLANHENEMGLDEGVEEGSSSVEPMSHDDRSSEESGLRTRNISMRQTPMSLTIEEQIEEVTTTYTSDEELRCSKINVLDFRNARRVPFPEFGMDIIDPSQDSSEDSNEDDEDLAHVDRITPSESWETNWLFQKKKIQTQSEPVAMLVPNPSSDYRALIGDKDAEDTSDLSDCSVQSDDEVEDEESSEVVNRVVPKSSKDDNDLSSSFNDVKDKNLESFDLMAGNGNESIDDKVSPTKIEILQSTNDKFKNGANCPNDDSKKNNLASSDVLIASSEFVMTNDVMKNNSESSSTNDSKSVSILDRPVVDEVERSIADRTSIDDTNIGKVIDEEPTKPEEPMISEVKTNDVDVGNTDEVETKESSRSEIAGDHHSKSSTSNDCLKVHLQDGNDNDCREIEGSDPWDDILGTALKNPSNETIKSNGETKAIKDDKIIATSTSPEDEHRKCRALAKAKADSASEKPSSVIKVNENIGLSTPPRPGTIAEREHKKWENAAPIENNPYSEENIQKRLLERQYARRSSDVSGNSTKLQTCPSPPLQIVLGASRPDFRRFGRDYYINEAKFPRGHSIEDNGFFTATSRPESSLSQNSGSTGGSDYEHQERSQSLDTDSTCSTSSDSKTKIIPESHQNNVKTALRRETGSIDENYEIDDETKKSLNDVVRREKNCNDRNFVNVYSERDRKNSKNVINARLNNRGSFEEPQKPIKRIDLRAYGFENEFHEKTKDRPLRSKRVVSKLDLKSFGYDSGLRRTQSNNNIDRPMDSRCNVRHSVGKSNLIGRDRRFSELPRVASLESSNNEILANDGEARVDDDEAVDRRKFGRITAAKSVPNIGDLYSRINDNEDDYRDEGSLDDVCRDGTNSMNEPNDLQRNLGSVKNVNYAAGDPMQLTSGVDGKLPMPSVRKLAQAFNKTEVGNHVTARRPSKLSNTSSKERPTTPEIHIVDSPRQMHSLTARSLSREFREGLRQMANNKHSKSTRPNVIVEQNQRSTIVQSPENSIGSNEDVSVIAPGKLKNDIKFWEQLQRKT